MAVGPTQLLQPLNESRVACSLLCVVHIHEYGDASHTLILLRARREGPCRHTADERDELAPPHAIPSSAVTSSDGGIVSPSALAVLRLIMSSYLVGCWTGNSVGLVPLRIRSM